MIVFVNGHSYETDSITVTASRHMKVNLEDASGIFYEGQLDKSTVVTIQERETIGWGVLPNAKTNEANQQETLFSSGFKVASEVDGRT